MEENTNTQTDTKATISPVPEDSPLRKLSHEDLLKETYGLTCKLWNTFIENNNLIKQNDLLMKTIARMIEATSVLRGGKGQGVAMHITTIVNKAIGKLKSGNYHPNIDEMLESVAHFKSRKDLPNERIKLATDAETALLAISAFSLYNSLSEEDKKKVDEQKNAEKVKIQFDNIIYPE